MSVIVSFGSCNIMLMGWGGLAPFADVGGSAWSSARWLGGRPLCVWFFSAVVGCGVVFSEERRGAGVLVRAALLLLVVIGDVSREWAVWLLFSLVSRFFLMFSIIVSCGCDAQGS